MKNITSINELNSYEAGKIWTQSSITSGDFNCVYYANSIWVDCNDSDNGLYYSTDGRVWIQSNITSGYFSYIYYANGVWIVGASYNKSLYYSEPSTEYVNK